MNQGIRQCQPGCTTLVLRGNLARNGIHFQSSKLLWSGAQAIVNTFVYIADHSVPGAGENLEIVAANVRSKPM
jgi:hypothetical protein